MRILNDVANYFAFQFISMNAKIDNVHLFQNLKFHRFVIKLRTWEFEENFKEYEL